MPEKGNAAEHRVTRIPLRRMEFYLHAARKPLLWAGGALVALLVTILLPLILNAKEPGEHVGWYVAIGCIFVIALLLGVVIWVLEIAFEDVSALRSKANEDAFEAAQEIRDLKAEQAEKQAALARAKATRPPPTVDAVAYIKSLISDAIFELCDICDQEDVAWEDLDRWRIKMELVIRRALVEPYAGYYIYTLQGQGAEDDANAKAVGAAVIAEMREYLEAPGTKITQSRISAMWPTVAIAWRDLTLEQLRGQKSR